MQAEGGGGGELSSSEGKSKWGAAAANKLNGMDVTVTLCYCLQGLSLDKRNGAVTLILKHWWCDGGYRIKWRLQEATTQRLTNARKCRTVRIIGPSRTCTLPLNTTTVSDACVFVFEKDVVFAERWCRILS